MPLGRENALKMSVLFNNTCTCTFIFVRCFHSKYTDLLKIGENRYSIINYVSLNTLYKNMFPIACTFKYKDRPYFPTI